MSDFGQAGSHNDQTHRFVEKAKFGSSEADQSAQEPDSSAAPESLDQEHSINGEIRGPVGIRMLHRDE